ncbi:MAG: hypothetical protein ACYTF1_00605, partial [Planctomycetota bacterium]
MLRYFIYIIIGVCLLSPFLVSVKPAWAFDNNGFQTNAVYAPELRRWILKWDGRMYKIRERDGYTAANFPPAAHDVDMYGVMLTDGHHWDGITFSGSGCDDARLFTSMTTWNTYRAWGNHTGTNSSTILEDTVQGQTEPDDYQYWGYMVFDQGTLDPLDDEIHTYALDKMTINNLTDGSTGTVKEGSGLEDGGLIDWIHAELSAPLAGGTDNTFQSGDDYEIECIPNPQARREDLTYYGGGFCKPYDFQRFEWGYTYGRHGNDVIIAEYGPPTETTEALQLNYKYLYTDLLGITTPEKKIRLAGSIRFNPFGNGGLGSLYIPVNEDVENDAPLKVYEIDLGLTTILNTYTGPNVGNERPSIAVNLDTGSLYAIAPNLGSTPPVNPEDPIYGDLIAWDTSSGGTSSYTTLIDSDANGGYPNWNNPHLIVYRGTNNPSGRPTILVDFDDIGGIDDPGVLQVAGVEEPTIEFYLDETDGNGDLVKRGNPLGSGAYMVTNGQLDWITGTVWLAGERPNDMRGLIGLNNDDSRVRYAGEARWYKWRDVASPGLIVDPPCQVAPDIVEVLPDPDPLAYAGTEYTRQMELETSSGVPAPTWSLLQKPTGAVIDPNTGAISGWTPTSGNIGNTFTFNAKAVNTQGEDTESWQVKVYDPEVLNNGFRKDFVYQVGSMVALQKEYGQTSTLHEEDGQFANAYWAAAGTNWYSLTFSGTGSNDARLFAFRPNEAAGKNYFTTDVYIAELDANANIINSAYLGELVGLGQGNLGTNVIPHNIRYNAYNNTLMIGINPDDTGYNEGTCTNPGDCSNIGTCNVGTCGTPGTCTAPGFCTDIGTCDTSGQCISSVCDSGPRVGEACSTDADCYECVGGFSQGASCTIDDDCPNACYVWPGGGDPPGPQCTTHEDCPYSCAGGAAAGEYCTGDEDCPAACSGGVTHGGACTIDADCVPFCDNG